MYDLSSKMLRNNPTIQGARRIRLWEFSYVKSLVSAQGGQPIY